MAKKQTRRSISVSRTTYERLKAFCESNNISMSQFVETRVGDFLGEGTATVDITRPAAPRTVTPTPAKPAVPAAPIKPASETRPAPQPVPMTSAAARYAVEPPPPVIKPKQEQPAPKPAEKRPEQIFTF
jgi:outer membrane biosynthesis protein TonB